MSFLYDKYLVIYMCLDTTVMFTIFLYANTYISEFKYFLYNERMKEKNLNKQLIGVVLSHYLLLYK